MTKIKPVSLNRLNIIMLFITMLMIIVTLTDTYAIEGHITQQSAMENNMQQCEKNALLLKQGSDYLTNQIWYFAATHKMIYLNNYWEEIYKTHRRERAMVQLSKLGLTEDEMKLIKRAKAESDDLMILETHAMKLIVSAQGVDESKLPIQVKYYQLTPAEQKMSANEKYNAGVACIFGDEYAERKGRVVNDISMFSDKVSQRFKGELNQAKVNTKQAIHFQRVHVFTLAFFMMLVLAIFNLLVIRPFHKYLKQLNEKKSLNPAGAKELHKLADAFNEEYNQVMLNEERFRIAASKTAHMILEYDLKSKSLIFLSHGINGNDGITKLSNDRIHTWHAMLHPDDLEIYEASWQSILDGADEERFEIRIKDLHKAFDGYRWYRLTASAVRNTNGKTIRVIVSLEDIDVQRNETISLRHKAEHDLLTGLLNRVTCEEEINRQLQDAGDEIAAAMLLLDGDNFKYVNDSFGHDVGDAVLHRIASNIKNCFRDTDPVGRLGGDEFMVWMKGISISDELIEQKITELNRMLTEPNHQNAELPSVTVSVGVAYAKTGDSFLEIYKRTDEALYKAKKNGKSRCAFFDDSVS